MDQNHLDQFNGKASVLVSEKSYINFMEGRENIGYNPDKNDLNGSMYISTSDDIDKALKDCNGDISKLESSLGFPEGHFGNGPVVRVDINNPEEHGLRVANGKEAGANEFYNTKVDENGNLPNIQYTTTSDGRWAVDTNKTDPKELEKLNGQYIDQNGTYHPPNTTGYDGKTSGGMPEAVVNQIPNNAENVSYTKIDGFKRGESGDLKTSQIRDGYSAVDNPNKINSQTVNAKNGGGARAPNNRINGNTDNPTKSKKASTKRGNRNNSPEPKTASRKNGNIDNTSKTKDNSNSLDAASNNKSPITQESAPPVDPKTTGATISNPTADTVQTLTEDGAQKAAEESSQKSAKQEAASASSAAGMTV